MEIDDDFQIKPYRTKSKKFAIDAVNYSLDEVAEKKGLITIFPEEIGCGSPFLFFDKELVSTDLPKKPI